MARPEITNLFFRNYGTEMHLNPKDNRSSGLKDILKTQIYLNSPTKIVLETGNGKRNIAPGLIRLLRELPEDELNMFLDEWAEEMHDAKEIIFHKTTTGANRCQRESRSDPRYNSIFENFIMHGSSPSLSNLDK